MSQTISEKSPLVLGSGSPRRREILTQLGIAFAVQSGSANEDVREGEAPDSYLERIVLAKLTSVRAALCDELMQRAAAILVADTSVVADGILGKPADAREALSMIERLGGRSHEVRTRFAIVGAPSATLAILHAETVVTRVTFRAITPAEAAAYAASGEGMDKAGGYALQGRASAFAERIDGSYTNVVGLPACELLVALQRHGLV